MQKLYYIFPILFLTLLFGCFEKAPEPTSNYYFNAKIGSIEWKTKQIGAGLEPTGQFGIVAIGDGFAQFQILIGFSIKQGETYIVRANTFDNTNNPNVIINFVSPTQGALSSSAITEQRGIGSPIGKITITSLDSKEVKGTFESKVANTQGITNVSGEFYTSLSK
jgi:hypothetical protein